MCGITGLWNIENKTPPQELDNIVSRMTDTLSHRGPDDSGTWLDENGGVALGHRRLSIIDLTSEGHQPMLSACGRYTIVYNGEVYNFNELRAELEPLGHSFRGHSDTEVILAAFAEWDVEPAVKKFIGMFAIALWDSRDGVLYLVRDRLGIKPVYYSWSGDTFVFGSEMKAICAHPDFRREINRDILPLYFHHGYVPSPYSIYRNTASLDPGCLLILDSKGAAARKPRIVQYWSALDVVEKGKSEPIDASGEEARDELEQLLKDSIKLRMISDVPLGAFLSGGIDSSAVVALMQAMSTNKIHTFTIGFHEKGYNEAVYAADVARHLGTDHTELYLTDREAMDVIPKIPEMYDEPFADSSQIPTHLVSWLTRKHVTVALTGDGGDELFGGYHRYRKVSGDWNIRRKTPHVQRKFLAGLLQTAARPGFNWLMLPALPFLWARGKNFSNMRERALHRARGLAAVDFDDFYNNSLVLYPDLEGLLLSTKAPLTVLTDPAKKPPLDSPVERMMYMDLLQYMPDDILTKVDRASMAVSLETRVPVIDHRVAEFAWRLPFEMKMSKNGTDKVLLREVLYKYVPRELIDRPKMGFGVPVGRWMRGPLREWAEELLSRNSLDDCGVFKTDTVIAKWKEHVAGVYDHEYMLWTVLMFQSWRKHWSAS